MQHQLSTDTIALVAASLTAGLLSTGSRKIDPADEVGSVLAVYWEFCAELEEAKRIGI